MEFIGKKEENCTEPEKQISINIKRKMKSHLKVFIKFWMILVLIVFLSCGGKTEKFRVFRFIDKLEEKNIVETPLKNLYLKFSHQEKFIKNKDFKIINCKKNNKFLFLAYQIKSPVLGGNSLDNRPKIKVFRNGRELKYLESQEIKLDGWTLLKKEREISINKPFFKGDEFQTEIIFPSGMVNYEIYVSNPRPKDYLPHLKLTLNNETAGEIVIKDKPLTLSKKMKLGKYKLELLYDRATKLTEVDERGMLFYLNKLKIITSSDILLIPFLKEKRADFLNDNYKISYYIAPSADKNFLQNKAHFSDYYSIYKTKHNNSFLLKDLGIENNPYSIKKKIISKGKSLNVIFAPPKTEFEYTIEVPDKAFLEFGYGLLKEFEINKKVVVEFKLIGETEGQRFLLFKEFLHLKEKSDEIPFFKRKINLSEFQKKKVKFRFITETVPLKLGSQRYGIGLSFWYNPVVYKSIENNIEDNKDINIILISIDTLRADHLGCYEYPRNTSPHIDRLASEGTQFNNAFSTSPWTLPAHISMLTSLTLFHHKVLLSYHKLNFSIVTLADILRKNGYFTSAFTGGVLVNSKFGFSKGFDFYQDKKLGGARSAKKLFECSFNWIKENKDKKFFIFLHTYQPHNPYRSPSPFGKVFLTEKDEWREFNLIHYLGGPKGKYRELSDELRRNIIALYDGEIRYTDEKLINPLINGLKKLNLYDRTMIIFTSDHGEEFYEHGAWEHGHTLYNELIKIPLIIKFPYSKYKGKKFNNFVSIIDIVPTILEELKINFSQYNLDGRNLTEIISQEEKGNRVFVSELYDQKEFPNSFRYHRYLRKVSINENQYKLILNINRFKYHYFFCPPLPQNDTIEMQLFDLKKDPNERVNIASQNKKLIKKLLKKLNNYYRKGKKEKLKSKEFSIDQELRDRLITLGYIN